MLEHKLCSLPDELLLFWGGGEEKFKIKARLKAEARAELGKRFSICPYVQNVHVMYPLNLFI